MAYELRYKINKRSFELILRTSIAALAYGMRKKLTLEKPITYKNKLIVKIVK
jgi:hypothetical protein